MTITTKSKITADEIDAAVVLFDTLLFAELFWADELTMPTDRMDLPKRMAGRQIISREQRIMFLAGCEYALLRDIDPTVTLWSPRKLAYRTSRKIAKTVGFEVRWVQIALTKTREGIMEGFIHTPGDAHLAPVRDRVRTRIETTPLFKTMEVGFNVTDGIHTWQNGWRWQVRVEGGARSAEQAGRSQVGVRAYAMLGDEADFSLSEMWEQREQSAMPTAFIYEGGVPRGVRGKFWRIANVESKSWFVFRADMRANPIYHSVKAWNDQTDGNYRSQRVQTQVLGMDGEEAVASFPIIPVDYSIPYAFQTVTIEDFERSRYDLRGVFPFPRISSDADSFMLAMDYGYSPSPSELFVLSRMKNVWFTIARYELLRCDPFPTAEIIHFVDGTLLPKLADIIVLDAHGQGEGVLSALHKNDAWSDMRYPDRVVDANFAGQQRLDDQYVHSRCRYPVVSRGTAWFCPRCNLNVYSREELSARSIPTKMYLLGQTKNVFAHGMRFLDDSNQRWTEADGLVLGNDEDVIDELSGTTEVQLTSSVRLVTQSGSDHILDGIFAAVAGIVRWRDAKRQQSTAQLSEFGWVPVAGDDSGEWVPPWMT